MNNKAIFAIDANAAAVPFPHYWEESVGSCHATTALRADWRAHMKAARADLGMKAVRFHGLFDDDMSVFVADQRSGETRYCFSNIDNIYDFLLEIGVRPFVELGFMPSALASGKQECFHYRANVTPPKDCGAWADLITAYIEHIESRYGAEEVRRWRFEVWNEPNLFFFWGGSQEDYFKLYEASARAIKAVDSELLVGGPATSMNAWIPEFVAFCERNDVPLDFVSTHHYPTDDPLWRGEITMEELMALGAKAASGQAGEPPSLKYGRGVLTEMASKTREQAKEVPLLYTEWSSSAMLPDPLHDESYTAAFVAKTIADNSGLVEAYSYWCVSDIFEESGQRAAPFHGGFGLQTIHGIPKPAYRAFQLMHALGDARLAVSVEALGNASTAEIIATRTDDGKLRLLAYNHQVPGEKIGTVEIELRVVGATNNAKATLARIDASHANPKARWIALGSPEYPGRREIEAMHAASALQPEAIEAQREGAVLVLRFELPAQALAAIDIGR